MVRRVQARPPVPAYHLALRILCVGFLFLGAACATATTTSPAGDSPCQSMLSMRFPALRVLNPQAIQADQLPWAVAELGRYFNILVAICVAPDGQVVSLSLRKSSGRVDLDQALLESISNWQYMTYQAPDFTRLCTSKTVVYHVTPPATRKLACLRRQRGQGCTAF